MKKKYINPETIAKDYIIPIMQTPASNGVSGNEPGGQGEWDFGGDGTGSDNPDVKERTVGYDLVNSLW